jgi:redox-sensitive bicupin YhaK (pirin superfamily)
MGLSRVKSPAVEIVYRTRGHTRGAVTRLMSPGDLGQLLKPFVVLDRFDSRDGPLGSFDWRPLSGLASLTHVFEGGVNIQDTNGVSGLLPAGSAAWLRAGRGAWHKAGAGPPARARGFRLQVALPPHLELGPSQSLYRRAADIPTVGPAQVLLGQCLGVAGPIPPPASMTYLAVRLKAGERWSYAPPRGHRVLWLAVSRGALEGATSGEILVLAPTAEPVDFRAQEDVDFVLGSAFPHPYDLVLSPNAAHTSEGTLAAGEAEIARQRAALVARGVIA